MNILPPSLHRTPTTLHETKHYQDEYDHLETNGMLTDIELSEDEVLSVLRNLDQNKAQGPDGIPGRLLIETTYHNCSITLPVI